MGKAWVQKLADMLPETVAKLATHKNIVGLKDATGNIARLKATQPLVPDDFVLLCNKLIASFN